MAAKYILIDELFAILGWLNSQRPGGADSHFGLFLVTFEDPQVLGTTFGAPDAVRRLDKFGKTVASGLRRGDLVTRYVADFWILTPECNSEMVGCRLSEIAAKVKELGLDIVHCKISAYVFPLSHAEPPVNSLTALDSLKNLPPTYKFDPASGSISCGPTASAGTRLLSLLV